MARGGLRPRRLELENYRSILLKTVGLWLRSLLIAAGFLVHYSVQLGATRVNTRFAGQATRFRLGHRQPSAPFITAVLRWRT